MNPKTLEIQLATRRAMDVLKQTKYSSVVEFIENVYLQGAIDMANALINTEDK